jgi:predicted amidohydrolase
LVVAAAQLSCCDDHAEANIQRQFALIAKAQRAGVDLLLFPQLSLTGYAGGATAPERGQVPDIRVLHRLAAACSGIAVSVGFPEEGATAIFYSTQALMRDGAILHRHRKVDLPTYGRLEEGKSCAAGRIVEPVRLVRGVSPP